MPETVIPVIDIFAGPGGLSEGFAQACNSSGKKVFKICLSIEKDLTAHKTLELRSFCRQFEDGLPYKYYELLRQEITKAELYTAFPDEAKMAKAEAWHAELGSEATTPRDVSMRIREVLEGEKNWVLIGGPPCQAYSIAGRSRNKGIKGYTLEKDKRHNLYLQYLKIIAEHWPAVFIMENVKGLLSSKLRGSHLFERILEDLTSPADSLNDCSSTESTSQFGSQKYVLHALAATEDGHLFVNKKPEDFIIKCENYGIPQARHRVIVLGVREDIAQQVDIRQMGEEKQVSVKAVIGSLPRIRSGLSKEQDNAANWQFALRKVGGSGWLDNISCNGGSEVSRQIRKTLDKVTQPKRGKGAEFLKLKKLDINYRKDWYIDEKIKGICNHTARSHIIEDLYRYLFAASFSKVYGVSPGLKDFPEDLLPRHSNIDKAISDGHFVDRFRVQVSNRPSTTITSHISKDGHYYIHYDPTQCRSLTVREVARLQTFPDNYFFAGGRTQQYVQVGNAVPPLLAKKIAEEVVCDIFQQLSAKG
ncbi:MAG: DNA cytosine methyltransferase [Thermoleophilia bacterium]